MTKNRQSELLGALDKIASVPPLDPTRIAVLICPPVSRFRVLAAVYLPAWIRRRFGLESDYVRSYTQTHGDAGQYWNDLGKPVLQTVGMICRVRIRSVLNARFQDLESVAASTHQVGSLLLTTSKKAEKSSFRVLAGLGPKFRPPLPGLAQRNGLAFCWISAILPNGARNFAVHSRT